MDKKPPRGLRNNNPGNVRHSPDAWKGEVYPPLDADFMTFDSMAHGVRCTAKILLGYQTKGLKTIRAMVARWAPPSENNTLAYANHVAKLTGFGIDQPMTLGEGVLRRLCAAIFNHELGGDFVTDADLSAGVRMALGLQEA